MIGVGVGAKIDGIDGPSIELSGGVATAAGDGDTEGVGIGCSCSVARILRSDFA